jgi:hypothetical protein
MKLRSKATVFAIVAAGYSAVAGAASPAFEGKVVVKEKAYDFKYAWMVRGATRLSPEKIKTYVIVSADDASERILRCENVTCAVWDAVQKGLVLEPDDDGFLVLLLDPDRKPWQFSGPSVRGSGWTETSRTPDRIAGRLLWRPDDGDPIFDFRIDAALLKAWESPPKK